MAAIRNVLMIAVMVSSVPSARLASAAQAEFFAFDALYSNADGTVQGLMMNTVSSGGLAGRTLVATSPDGTVRHVYTFPHDLPSPAVNCGFVVGTEGFASTIGTPDFVIPNNFLTVPNGVIAIDPNVVHYRGLPADGVNALWFDGDGGPDVIAPPLWHRFLHRCPSGLPVPPGTPSVRARLHVSHYHLAVQGEPTGTTVRPVYLTNVGDEPLRIIEIALDQPASNHEGGQEFAVRGTCAAGTVLAAQSRCRVDVALISPGVGAASSGRLSIATDASPDPYVVALAGQVCDPQDCDFLTVFTGEDVRPKWLDFPPQSVGGSHGPISLRTYNYRGHEGSVFMASLRGGDAASFRVDSVRCTRTARPDCSFDILFAPRATGPLAAELVIHGPSASQPAVFSVMGYGGPLASPLRDVIEYYHPGRDHYLVTASRSEILELDTGQVEGWWRTGRRFKAFDSDHPGSQPVCRIHVRPGFGDSHFHSADPLECALPDADSTRFALETGEAFRLFRPLEVTGGCPEHSDPVFRLWNRREDVNHVYTTDTTFRDALRERGYILEGYGPDGVNMCAPSS